MKVRSGSQAGECARTDTPGKLQAHCLLGSRRLQTAKPTFAAMERPQRFGEIFVPEVGPHSIGKMHLGVAALPPHQVSQPLFAAGPDDEIELSKVALSGTEPPER